MMDIDFGKKGEDLVADYLKKKGCIIFKRNYISRFGEIDIIAEKGNLIMFVEVKTRAAGAMVLPSEAVDSAKMQRLKLTAGEFASKLQTEFQFRFDVCEVTVIKESNSYRYSLNYIKNAFM